VNRIFAIFAVGLVAFVVGSAAPAHSSEPESNVAQAAADLSGMHDFDFEHGTWRVHHRVKRQGGSGWSEFDGNCRDRGLIDGSANVEEHTFDKPAGVSYGVGLRAYDRKTGQWAIWWVDGRDPHGPLDPPVKGRFENGVGTFYSDYLDNGKPMRLRFTWSHITPISARWEQATSSDAGKTWAANWIMEFRRIDADKSIH